MTATNASALPSRRIWYLDLLRILATYGVVLVHSSPLPAEYSGVETLAWKAVITLSVLFRWCVPVFFMISGALFLSPDRKLSISKLYRKSCARIAVCYAVWSAFYAVVHCVLMNKGKWTFMNQFLRGHYHMWFIFAILSLYMLTPLIRRMTESGKLTEYFLGLGFVFAFLLPRLISFVLLFDIPSKDVVLSLQSAIAQLNPLPNACVLYYYVLGHYLHAYTQEKKMLRLSFASGILGLSAAVLLTIWHSNAIGAVSGRFYDLSSLTILPAAVCVFLFFKHGFSGFAPGKRASRVLLSLSACSFGIYLVHPFIIERLPLSIPMHPLSLVSGMLLISSAVFVLSFCISWCLQRIPAAGKYIV